METRLLRKITREYTRKGYPLEEAQRISRATVYGKIARAKKQRTKRTKSRRRT